MEQDIHFLVLVGRHYANIYNIQINLYYVTVLRTFLEYLLRYQALVL